MIVDCAVYRHGKRVELAGDSCDLSGALAEVAGTEEFIWIGLHEPTQQEMARVAEAFSLHRLAVEDAVQAHQRPKLECFEDKSLFMVLKTLWYVEAEGAVETGQIGIFVGPNYVVTVRHGEGAELHHTRMGLEEHTDMLGHGPFAVLYSVCDRVVDEYQVVAEELENDVDEMEKDVFSEHKGNYEHRIYHMKREIAEFRRAVTPLREPLLRFSQGMVEGVPSRAEAFFRDVADHTVRVHEQVESMDSLLSSAHDALMARITVRQNNDMRKISAWVAIAAIPTMVAAIYGMNFTHMPELHWTYGYPLVLVAMATACSLLYVLFKRSGWL